MPEIKHIGPLIKLLNKEFERLHTQKANSLGLTPSQLFVLHYIAKHQGENICHRDIEKQFELTHATVSGIISRLEAKGFINCHADENDRRYRNIVITDKAKCVESEMKNHIELYEAQLVEGFSEEEKELLISFIVRLMQNVNVNPKQFPGRKEND
ncbi:MAG: MarR family transcriptional regulator [Clostridia bacterium]|nr:MarR family transcriptional regulator [Clostridia bacterium]